jgi:hypothetical protein
MLISGRNMDFRFDLIQSHFELCLRDAGVFERSVEGSQLFDVNVVRRSDMNWLVIAAGISDAESQEWFSEKTKRERASIPLQVIPNGQASLLLMIRPWEPDTPIAPGKFVTDFTSDVKKVELHSGYLRVDGLASPAVEQVRWELDPVEGHKTPLEPWLRPWSERLGCNPAHAPSHWHINSPPIEEVGRRKRRRVVKPPELRLATGLPNPLLLVLSLANWLRQG